MSVEQNPIYKYQTELTFTVHTEASLANASTQRIQYLKPDGTTTGSWAASVSNATLGYMTYAVQATGDLDTSGVWKLWGYVQFTGGGEAWGKADEVYIHPRPWE